jgi:hypothetical protein
MKRNLLTSVWVVFLLCMAGIVTVQASTTIIFSVDMATNLANSSFNPPPPAGTGTDTIDVRGAFNGWAPLLLVQEGSSTVWTNSATDNTLGTTFDYKFYLNGNGETTACYDNRTALLPSTDGTTLVLPTHYYGDVGPGVTINVKFQVDMTEEIQLGHFHPLSGDTLVAAGSFDGWSTAPGANFTLTNDPTIVVTNNSLVESNVYTVTAPITQCSSLPGLPAVNSSQDFKYVEMPAGNWENSSSADSNDNGNRWFSETGNLTLPVVSFSDLAFTPNATVTLNVDMSGAIKYDTNYVPNSVVVWGTFNGWANGVPMTNNPAPNTNIFSAVMTMPERTANIIQVRYTNSVVAANNPSSPWVFDFLDDAVFNNNARRTVTLPVTGTPLTTNMPAFYFLDLAPDDYLSVATPVLFSVNMAGAVQTNGTPFSPGSDSVYINGMFANGGGTLYPQTWYTWAGGINPVSAPPGYQMMQEGSSTIYTNTIVMPAGTPVALSYQYGIDPGSVNGGPLENEAPPGANHFRVVRSTVGSYSLPVDTFTNQPYMEPLFAPGNIDGFMGTLAGGNLSVGRPMGGVTPVSWLGRPGAHLQSAASITGPWTDVSATDGNSSANGVNTSNGLMSVTNWPTVGGAAFFRLVKP